MADEFFETLQKEGVEGVLKKYKPVQTLIDEFGEMVVRQGASIRDLKSRIAELEAENKELRLDVKARDEVLNRFGIMDVQHFCKTCAFRNRNCTTISRNCITGNIEFARKEIEG